MSYRWLQWPTENGPVVLQWPEEMSADDERDALSAVLLAFRSMRWTPTLPSSWVEYEQTMLGAMEQTQ